MRKILSKEQEEKKRRRNQLIIGGVLILVMLASSLGYAFTREQTSNTDKIIYNGREFVKTSGLWDTNIGSQKFSFLYNPLETAKINSVLNLLSSYSGKPLYIYSDSSDASAEIYRNLFYQNQIVQRVQNACLTGEKCDASLPVKNCTDNLIVIKESNTTDTRQQENCVFISGSSENLTSMSDGFLFKITGIQ